MEKDKEKMLTCPFNKSHNISSFKFLSHIHKCKDGKGKLEKLVKCKKDSSLMFYDKEDHLKSCGNCYQFYCKGKIKKTNDSFVFSKMGKMENDSYSIFTENFNEKFLDQSSLEFVEDFNSFLDLGEFVSEKKERERESKMNDLSDIDLSNVTRKI